ncbi:MAG TPA: YjjG family noncanonical pyrimidine nucleotidase [Bacteroidales bacterium]|nr:YjjG family noncanonical pyrimidine nucleotidase [Bacteroidales bacterium]
MSSKKYTHLFFDLDRTLWDFETNARSAFQDIFKKHDLHYYFNDFDTFLTAYHKHNERLWMAYRQGKIKKKVLRTKRFYLTLKEFGIDSEDLAKKIGDEYIDLSPKKTALFPDAIKVLEYLKSKYQLYIITNGFNEVQFIKMENAGLSPYFRKVFTSENAGYQKPHPGIFAYCLNSVNARKTESIMVGDDPETDIQGAKNFGLDQVFFNPGRNHITEKPTFEIEQLIQLTEIF